MRFHRYPIKESLSILQINVGRGVSAHEIALFQAYSNNIDIILIQEPYIFENLARKITKKHPSYECFSPTDSWVTSGRPRVLTYIRKKKGIQASQLQPDLIDQKILSDFLLLQIFARSGQSTLICNVYNAPAGTTSIRPNLCIQALINLPDSYFSQPTLLAGDFNLLHSRWQTSLQRGPSTLAEPVSEWLDRLGLVFISKIDIPTHDKDNTLDLTFASGFLALVGARTKVTSHLDVISDHCPLFIILPWGQRQPEAL
jgi:endonuclease/exonuclease/phosphatase family metal-dependent hydrolase